MNSEILNSSKLENSRIHKFQICETSSLQEFRNPEIPKYEISNENRPTEFQNNRGPKNSEIMNFRRLEKSRIHKIRI